MGIKHSKVSSAPEGLDPSKVRASYGSFELLGSDAVTKLGGWA